MNILYTGDDRYVMITAVSIVSLINNNRWDKELHFYIVDAYRQNENREKLKQLIADNGADCHFLPEVDYEGLIGKKINYARWCRVAFARLFLGELFHEYPDVHRILYIDCDTMIRGGLKALWSMDLEGRAAAVVREPFCRHHWRNIGLTQDTYFNNGVLLIDIDKWREEQLDEAAANFLYERNGKVPYADQGVNNYILSGKVKYLHPKYNFMTMNVDMSYTEMMIFRKPIKHYSEKTYAEAAENPVIVHFTTCFLSKRVWLQSSTNPYKTEWMKYKAMTPWKDMSSIEERVSGKDKLKELIIKLLPRLLVISGAGFLHSYIKPIKDRM